MDIDESDMSKTKHAASGGNIRIDQVQRTVLCINLNASEAYMDTVLESNREEGETLTGREEGLFRHTRNYFSTKRKNIP